jgi:hypothetical protein
MEKVMFGQKARKITELSNDVSSFKALYQRELAANKSMSELMNDIRWTLGVQDDGNIFEAINQLKLDLSSALNNYSILQDENNNMRDLVRQLKVEIATLQAASVAANLPSNDYQPDKPKRKRITKRKKG